MINLEPVSLLPANIENKTAIEFTMSDQVDVLLYGLGA